MTKSIINKICLRGFILRVIMLCCTLIFSEQLTTGYLRSNYDSDDLRYQDGALYYSQNANSIIDVSAFTDGFLNVGDYTGYGEGIALWYWLVCVLTYIVKSTILVKVINILFGVACIRLIYELCLYVYPEREDLSLLAAKLYAYMPYPIIFCCFLYKDQFLTLIFLAILFVVYRSKNIINIKDMSCLIALLVVFSLIRSGMLPVLVLCIAIIETNKTNRRYSSTAYTIVIALLAIVAVYYVFLFNNETIAHKLNSYVDQRTDNSSYAGTIIQYVLINDFKDFWKLPFAYLFTILQPLYIGGGIKNWENLISIFNVCFIPIVISNIFYLLQKKKGNTSFWLSMMLLFSVMLFVSIGVTRHFYYLMFLPIIFYADYATDRNSSYSKTKKPSIVIACGWSVFMIFRLLIP